jgi:hypothetical protein
MDARRDAIRGVIVQWRVNFDSFMAHMPAAARV